MLERAVSRSHEGFDATTGYDMLCAKTGLASSPEGVSKDASYNATDDLLPVTQVICAVALSPGIMSELRLA